jgi:hypothetical protein
MTPTPPDPTDYPLPQWTPLVAMVLITAAILVSAALA